MSSYSDLEEPDRADHLWRYTPWHRIHPTGNHLLGIALVVDSLSHGKHNQCEQPHRNTRLCEALWGPKILRESLKVG